VRSQSHGPVLDDTLNVAQVLYSLQSSTPLLSRRAEKRKSMRDECVQTDARSPGVHPPPKITQSETPVAPISLGRPSATSRNDRSPPHISRTKDKSYASASLSSTKVAKKNTSNGKFSASMSRSTSSGHSSEIPPLVCNGPHVNGITGKPQPETSMKHETPERKPSSSPFKIRIPGRSQMAQTTKLTSVASASVSGKLTANAAHSSSPTPRRSSRRHASLVVSNGDHSSNGDSLHQPNIVSGD